MGKNEIVMLDSWACNQPSGLSCWAQRSI